MTYSGLCVGGPAAGTRVACEAPFYRVAVPPPDPGWRNLSAAHFDLTLKPFTYEFVVGVDLGRENLVNFWVPQGQDVRWAIGQLLSTYEEAQRAL